MTAPTIATVASRVREEDIPVDLIDWEKVQDKERTRDPKFAQGLADTIEHDGLLNRIHVKPHPKKPGRYIGLAGYHRHQCVSKTLKWKLIPCKVYEAATDDDYRAIEIADNLFRNPLSKLQASKLLADWARINEERLQAKYAAKKQAKADKAKKTTEPPAEVPAAAVEEPQTDAAAESDDQPIQEPESAAEPIAPEPEPETALAEPTAEPAKNFAAEAAKKTGMSRRAVKRSVRVGKAFSEEQLALFDSFGVGLVTVEAIAALPENQRNQIVSLIASGMDAIAAIGEVTGDTEIKLGDGSVREVEPKGAVKNERTLSDDEWLATYCGDAIKRLPEPTRGKFRDQALLYRQTKDLRRDFSRKIEPILETHHKSSRAENGFFATLARIIGVDHPKNWMCCGTCDGTGSNKNGGKCNDCRSLGFVVTFTTLKFRKGS